MVWGNRMTSTGCQCVVANFEPKQQRLNEQNPTATLQESNKTVYQVKNKSHVVLPGMIPGMILQTPFNTYDSIVREARLPLMRRCSVLTFDSPFRKLHPRRSSLQPLPCQSASRRNCEHCPWMALGSVRSAELKAEVMRNVLHTVAEAASSSCLHQVTEATKVVSTVDFLEPLSIPVKPHYLQELELVYSSDKATGGRASSGDPAKHTFTFAVTAFESSHTSQDCFLLTLEQKRLVVALNRWANQLPMAMRDSLRMAWIAQLSPEVNVAGDFSIGLTTSNSTSSEPRWQSILSLVVYLKRDVDYWGPQSPLCGLNHPPELLSHEEQGLVDAVLAAAPLQKDVHVLVALDNNKLEVLYPVMNRGVRWEDIMSGTGGSLPEGIPTRPALNCTCDAIEAFAYIPLPGFHSHLCYTLNRRYLHQATSKDAYVENHICTARPAFWRHPRALSTTCSVATTLLLDSGTLPTDCFFIGIFTKGLHSITSTSTASFTIKHLRSTPLAESQMAATMLLSEALGAAIHVFADRLDKKYCAGVMKLDETSEKNKQVVKSVFPSASFFIIATVTNATSDSYELCELICAWRDQLLQQSTHPAPIFRLMLLQCATDMALDALKIVVEEVLESFGRSRSKPSVQLCVSRIQAGIVDVDPLSASLVGYTLLELSWVGLEHKSG